MSDLIKRLGASCYLAFEDGTNDYSAAQEAIDRITDLRNHNKDLTLQLLAAHGQAADALDKLATAVALALMECPYEYDTKSYDNWWDDRRAVLAALEK